jgi:hypothetical protein
VEVWTLKQVQGDGDCRRPTPAFFTPLGSQPSPGRRGHPKTKWRPALLPASTVPGSVGPARRRDRLSQGGSGRGLAAPVGPSGSFAGSLLIRFRFLRVPRPALRPASVPWRVPSSRPCGFELKVPCRTFDEANFFDVLSPFLPPGGFRFRRTLEGKWVRLRLAPLPRASSFRLPGPCFLRPRFLRTSAVLRSAVPGSVSPFPKRPLPCDKRTLAPESESRKALNRLLGLWITGITGINMD